MTTLIGSLTSVIQEELSPSVWDAMHDIDPISDRFMNNSLGVQRDRIGRDWKVIHEFYTSLAGAFKWETAAGSNILSAPSTSVVYDTLRTFPGASESSALGTTQRSLTLVQGTGNFILPLHIAQADQLSSMVARYVASNMKAVGKMVANTKIANFYASDTFNSFAAVDTVSAGGTTEDATVTFTINSGRIRSMFPGVFVDLYDATGNTIRHTGKYAIIQSVDLLSKAVTVVTTDASKWSSQVVATDIVVPKDSKSLGPSGLEDWIKNTGTVFGITLATYPQFKSLVATGVGSLDETLLNRYVGSFDDAYGTLVSLDTIITTGGVTREFLSQSGSFSQYARQGATVNMQAGWADIGYSYNGKKYNWLISANCAPGTMYVTKTGDGNLTRYCPPPIRGITSSGSERNFPQDIQFFAPMAGSKNIFMPAISSGGAIAQGLQCPFFTLEEIAPMYPQSIKLSGLTEDNA